MIRTTRIQTVSFAVFVAACLSVVPPANAQEAAKPPTESTKAANAAVLQELPFSDKTSFELAHKGFIAPLPQEVIQGKAGNPVWDPKKYSFIKEGEAAPDTVNPSLWRQSQLLNISGLFEVTDGIYHCAPPLKPFRRSRTSNWNVVVRLSDGALTAITNPKGRGGKRVPSPLGRGPG